MEDKKKEERAEEEIRLYEEAEKKGSEIADELPHKIIERQLSMDDNEGGVGFITVSLFVFVYILKISRYYCNT